MGCSSLLRVEVDVVSVFGRDHSGLGMYLATAAAICDSV